MSADIDQGLTVVRTKITQNLGILLIKNMLVLFISYNFIFKLKDLEIGLEGN